MRESKEFTNKQSTTSFLQSFFTGSVAGFVEVFCNHPLWTLKTRSQQGEPFTLKLPVLYCGLVPNMLSMVPTTALQVGVNQLLQNMLLNGSNAQSFFQNASCAFVGGLSSAMVSCPTELVLSVQGARKQGGGLTKFFEAGKHVVDNHGWNTLGKGFVAAALRDGKFSVFWQVCLPYVKQKVSAYVEDKRYSTALATVLTGLGATAVSQVHDVVKSKQQDPKCLSKKMNFFDVTRKVYQAEGYRGLFTGMVWRSTRVTSALFLMGAVKDKMKDVFDAKNKLIL